MQDQMVSIITLAQRQDDDTFEKFIQSVFSSKDAAREELSTIKRNFENVDNWRARTPFSQIDDLSVEFFEDGNWTCKSFYSIVDKVVQS